jgi:hypothetical protein
VAQGQLAAVIVSYSIEVSVFANDESDASRTGIHADGLKAEGDRSHRYLK